jgi:hypothetical protein
MTLCIECLPVVQEVRFPTETYRSRMLYAEDVGGLGQAPTYPLLKVPHLPVFSLSLLSGKQQWLEDERIPAMRTEMPRNYLISGPRPHFRPACTPDSYEVTNTWIKRKHLLPIYSSILSNKRVWIVRHEKSIVNRLVLSIIHTHHPNCNSKISVAWGLITGCNICCCCTAKSTSWEEGKCELRPPMRDYLASLKEDRWRAN